MTYDAKRTTAGRYFRPNLWCFGHELNSEETTVLMLMPSTLEERSMNKEIDTQVAMNFVISLGTMIGMERLPDPVPNPRPVMFSFNTRGQKNGLDDQDLKRSSSEEGCDIICLTFEPGREHDGPANITICEEREGEIIVWANCSPWSMSAQGPFILVADGADVGFAYDGTSIVMTWEVPQDQRAERVKAGRELLRRMSQCVPKDIKHQRLR